MLQNKEFTDIINLINQYYQLREKIKIESEYHDKTMNQLEENLQNKFNEISTIDGIKAIIDDNSWVLVRKSNTEDIIRISSESDNLEKTQQIQQNMIRLVKQSYEEIK
jgi:phosphomannomutase